MTLYEAEFTVPAPGDYTTYLEFSPNGRFLAVGESMDPPSVSLLDGQVGFGRKISTITQGIPTAHVWESSGSFFVGFGNGRITNYRIDSKEENLVKGITTHPFRGVFPVFPITAMALNANSETLAVAMGPDIFAFRRINAKSKLLSSTNQGFGLTFLKAIFVLSPEYPVGFILQMISGGRTLRSREPFALVPEICSL
jgi:hypothetical protein